MNNRTVIVINKKAENYRIINATAIVMGQLSLKCEDMYYNEVLFDLNQVNHSAIKDNVIILAAKNDNQLLQFLSNCNENKITSTCFSELGANISNNYDSYKSIIVKTNTKDTKLIAAAAYGEEEIIRSITKKFSVYKS